MMFDDYDYKSSSLFQVTFKQRSEDRLLPWEIAAFFNQFNTVYYKNDLLNSISSALLRGISPKDIVISEGSLPLNRRYAKLDLLPEFEAARYFYPIGKPHSLVPSIKTRNINFLYENFYGVNSLLHSRKFRPLGISYLVNALKIQSEKSDLHAEQYLITTAIKFSEQYHKKYSKHYSDRTPIEESDITAKLSKIKEKQNKSLSILKEIENFDDTLLERVIFSTKKEDKKYQKELEIFFEIFNHTTRPVVYIRVGDGYVRILSRSLVNKTVGGGLELKSAKKNSPLLAIFQGAATLWQTQVDVQHKKEMHKMEILIKEQQLREATAKANMEEEKFQQFKKISSFEVANEIIQSDIFDHQRLPESHIKSRLNSAYASNQEKSRIIYTQQDMEIVKGSMIKIDIQA